MPSALEIAGSAHRAAACPSRARRERALRGKPRLALALEPLLRQPALFMAAVGVGMLVRRPALRAYRPTPSPLLYATPLDATVEALACATSRVATGTLLQPRLLASSRDRSET